MGVEYRGVICVGYTYEQVKELHEACEDENGEYKYEDIYEFCEGEGLESFSPYYDADYRDCIFGREIISSGDYNYTEIGAIDLTVLEESNALDEKFFTKPKAYLMAHGW